MLAVADDFEKSFPHLEKNDLEKLKSIMDPFRPLVDLADLMKRLDIPHVSVSFAA